MQKTKMQIFLRDIVRDRWLYAILIPSLIFLVIFKYGPMYGLQIAFKDYNLYRGVAGSEWAGLEHFQTFFQSPYFWRLIRNTLLLSLYGLVFTFPAPLLIALAFNELSVTNKLRKIGTSISYMPHFISSVVVAGMFITFLSPSTGIINTMREMLGMERYYFLNDPKAFRAVYTTMDVWKGAGFSSIVYLSALAGIDQSLYEAVDIDGGGRWQKLRFVTLPGITPTIIILLIVRLGNMLSAGYESIMLLYNPNTYETADVIQTFVFRNGMENYQYSYAAAAGLFQSVIALLLVVGANTLSRKLSETSLW